MLAGRRERRGAVTVHARLQSLDARQYCEAVAIENISRDGARVVTQRPLRVHDHVMLIAPMGALNIAAEVVYCECPSGDRCAVGLRFLTGIDVG
jgi:hypothetical protein